LPKTHDLLPPEHWYTYPRLQPYHPSPQKRPALTPLQSHFELAQARWCQRKREESLTGSSERASNGVATP
jgi:hypothetical protein